MPSYNWNPFSLGQRWDDSKWLSRVNTTDTGSDGAVVAALGVAVVDANGDQITSFGSPSKSGTATLSNVAGSASSVTLLASNTSRLGATIYNDSSAALYVKFGSSASTTSFVVKLVQDAYYEVPFSYTGIITGIWGSATGSARVTEMTA